MPSNIGRVIHRYRKFFFLSGVTILIVAAGFSFLLVRTLFKARGLDTVDEFRGKTTAGMRCADVASETHVSKRIISENESVLVTVTLTNRLPEKCEAEVKIYISDFDISPPQASQSVEFSSDQERANVLWSIRPRKGGEFQLATLVVQERVETVGIIVTNFLGFTPFQAQILSIMGSALGPVLTVPWWYERWKERRRKKKPSKRKRREKIRQKP